MRSSYQGLLGGEALREGVMGREEEAELSLTVPVGQRNQNSTWYPLTKEDNVRGGYFSIKLYYSCLKMEYYFLSEVF